MARDGCDVVGITLLPEAALARQLGLRYVALCLVVNMAASCGDGPVDVEEVLCFIKSFESRLLALVRCVIERVRLHE